MRDLSRVDHRDVVWVRPVTDTEAIMAARRAVCDALHGMHFDQGIIVSMALALILEHAWEKYDQAIRDDQTERLVRYVGHYVDPE